MKTIFLTASAIALLGAMPASAQILGGGGSIGGGIGGSLGGTGGNIGGMIGGTVNSAERATNEAAARARAEARAQARADRVARRRGVTANAAGDATALVNTRIGERRVSPSGSAAADAKLSLDQRMLRTRGAVSATRRGLRRAKATASGVQVFVPSVVVAAPPTPVVRAYSYPAYGGGYYYGPGAVYVEDRYVDVYVDHQYQDLEAELKGTGATVQRRGDDLIVLFPADVTFAFDKDSIRPRFYGALSAFARTMNTYPGSDVEVVGHTDSVGTETYNLGLSERRSRAVAEFLTAQQVAPQRMVVEAMGESEPVATNATAEGRAANRRVELIVHPRAG